MTNICKIRWKGKKKLLTKKQNRGNFTYAEQLTDWFIQFKLFSFWFVVASSSWSKRSEGGAAMADGNRSNSNKPEWLQQYDLIGKIGEGTYGLVFLARIKSATNRGKSIAIKKFKQSKDGDGVSPTAIREIMVWYFFPSFFCCNFSPIFVLQLMKGFEPNSLKLLDS